jgi:orotidine-5'-phosphate decarboxylase
MDAISKLKNANNSGKYICVGLDTDPKKLPVHLSSSSNPVLEFNQRIIESTKDLAAAYKLNLAFYESQGTLGFENLTQTLSLIPNNILIIADGKRGDIGNTSNLYARSIFDHFNFDASTLNPFMGKDSIEPFLDYKDKLNFILVLTSNPGSADFQKQKLDTGKYLYQEVLKKIHSWNANSNCGIVFGATNLNELKENLNLIDNLPMLIPGIGAQGGSLQDITKTLFTVKKSSFLINVSRGIIYKSKGEDFDEAAKEELQSLNQIIAKSTQA